MNKIYTSWILGLVLTVLMPVKDTLAEPSLLIVPNLEAPVQDLSENGETNDSLTDISDEESIIAPSLFNDLSLEPTVFSVQGETDDTATSQDQRTEALTGIIMSSPPSLFIELSRDGQTWHTFDIQSNKSHLFNCNRYKKIRVLTVGNDVPAEYDVQCLNRYAVYWNQQLQRWDIATIVRD